ncbi:MAG TPA: hypothetical protein VII05_04960 [Gaiellaceae bacterium]|jgi:hypothetical protein
MRITRNESSRPCAICGRRMLMGEQFGRFSSGGTDELVEVCRLCAEKAIDHGWTREGAPTTPTRSEARKKRGLLSSLFGIARDEVEEPVLAEPILRRLGDDDMAVVEAADVFNTSPYRRTVGGVARSLGEPHSSIVALSGAKAEFVLTVAWDLSWYQYRISLDAAQPVRLVERGHELQELKQPFTNWNAHVEEDGRVIPNVARIDSLG